ncbi:MAG: hypothetical protein QXO69_03010, partial [archaeon]
MISETFYERFSPLARRFSEGYLARMKTELTQARIRRSPVEFVSLCLGTASCAGIASLLSFAFAGWLAFPLSLVVFSSVFLASSRYPSLKKISFAKSVEKEMRFALRYFAVQ